MKPNAPFHPFPAFLLTIFFLSAFSLSPAAHALDQHLEDHDGAHLFMHEIPFKNNMSDLQFFFISNESVVNALYLEVDLGEAYKNCSHFEVNKAIFPLILENAYDGSSVILALASPQKGVESYAYIGHIICKTGQAIVDAAKKAALDAPSRAYAADGYGTPLSLSTAIPTF